MIELSDDQRLAYEQVLEWFHEAPTQRLRLGGYAGTGKSTLIDYLLRSGLGSGIRVCAFTGKAAYVLRRKGVPATTIHRLIYVPEDLCRMCDLPAREPRADAPDEPVCRCPGLVRTRLEFVRTPVLGCRLVIVDEASMISTQIQQDLESFDIPVLYIGDHGQLEPIGDNPQLMRDPDVRLERIHRQAEASAIIRFAHHVRLGGSPRRFESTPDVQIMTDGRHPPNLHEYDVVLCALNRTRVEVNTRIRTLLGRQGSPVVGERVICLRNSSEHQIFNGLVATITWINFEGGVIEVIDEDGKKFDRMPFYPPQFGAEEIYKDVPREVTLWDYGYALTVHKAQGSSYDRAVVLERIPSAWAATRWRYTAVTRAAKELVYCVPR